MINFRHASVSCRRLSRRMEEKTYAVTSFLKEFLHEPALVGSVCPSSKALTGAMVKAAPLTENGLFIDLGAGSGVVSKRLLQAGVSPARILALDIAPGFAETFRRNCPDVNLLIGDARHLEGILAQYAPGMRVCGIISSLPFRIMPSATVQDILCTLRRVMLLHNAALVQYSYALWMRYPLRNYGLVPRLAEIVVANLPPARVEVYSA